MTSGDTISTPEPPSREPGVARERKNVTVFFSDTKGSTSLIERVDPEVALEVLDLVIRAVSAAVQTYGGTVIKTMGDGLMAIFGVPFTQEDHARRACRAALDAHRAVDHLQEAIRRRVGGELRVRIGLNSGTVVMSAAGEDGRQSYDATGLTVHLASRMEALAEAGSSYLTASTFGHVRADLDCRPLGWIAVKGMSDLIEAFQLVAARVKPTPSDPSWAVRSPFIGRERELRALARSLASLPSGEGGVVLVIGDARVGKTRLLGEAKARHGTSIRWLEGHGHSFGRSLAYWPFREIFRAEVGIEDDDARDVAWSKLSRRVSELCGDEQDEILPYIATLLAIELVPPCSDRVGFLDSRALGANVLRAVRRYVEHLSAEMPTVLMVDDLYWIDEASATLMTHLLQVTRTAPVLLCCVTRSESRAEADALLEVARREFSDRTTEILLEPLVEMEALQLISNLLGQGTPGLCALIQAKTEGNPLFAEEVVRALRDARLVIADQVIGLTRPVVVSMSEIRIPDTVQGVVMARVDRLERRLTDVLRLSAVIGRTFLYRVLAAATERIQELDRHVTDLVRVELLAERARLPEIEYMFRHGVVQQAVYESILIQRRRLMHRRIGECLERLFADRLEEFSGALAFHYARAEEWAKAHRYLLQAGDQAHRLCAAGEALQHYEEAVDAYMRAFGERKNAMVRHRGDSRGRRPVP